MMQRCWNILARSKHQSAKCLRADLVLYVNAQEDEIVPADITAPEAYASSPVTRRMRAS